MSPDGGRKRPSNTTPLIKRSISETIKEATGVRLYESSCMLQLDEDVAHGYIVILGGRGGTGNDINNNDEESLTLGYLALMEGNVLDVCFGARSSMTNKDSKSREQINKVKALIGNAADANEVIEKIAVLAYREGFRAVARYQTRRSKLNCLTYCFRYKRYKREAEADLKASFVELYEAIQASR